MLRLDPFQITVGGFFFLIFLQGGWHLLDTVHGATTSNSLFLSCHALSMMHCQVRMSMLGDLVRSVLSLQWSGPVKNYWFLAQGYVVFKKCFCFSSRNRRHFKVRCVIFTTLGSANRRSPNRLLKRGTKKAIINGENLYNHLQDIQLLKTPLHCIIISKLDFTWDLQNMLSYTCKYYFSLLNVTFTAMCYLLFLYNSLWNVLYIYIYII